MNDPVPSAKREAAERDRAFDAAVAFAMREASLDGILVVDKERRILSYNQRFLELWGVPEDLAAGRMGDAVLALAGARVADEDAFLSSVAAIYADPSALRSDDVSLKDGRTFGRYSAPVTLVDGTYIGRVWFFSDKTESRRSARTLTRLNRTLKTLSTANGALVRARGEQQLRDDFCRIITEVGGYRLAWIGFAEHDEARTVRPVAWAGPAAGFMTDLRVSWSDGDVGRGPTGEAVRTGAPHVNGEFEDNPAVAPWRQSALAHGFRSSIALPLTDASGVFGTLTIYSAEGDAFDGEEVELLSELAGDLSFGIAAQRARADVQAFWPRLNRSLVQTVTALANTVEMRDGFTAGHMRRVSTLATAIARRMGLSEDAVQGVQLGAAIHDVGKIQIPIEILTKPGKLSALEYAFIKTHAQAGHNIVAGIDFPWPVAQMILQHHERLDGSGYPNGLKGAAILLETRILSVADTVEAMTARRPYRLALPIETAVAEITTGRSRLYDPAAVDACLAVLAEHGLDFA